MGQKIFLFLYTHTEGLITQTGVITTEERKTVFGAFTSFSLFLLSSSAVTSLVQSSHSKFCKPR